MADAFRATRLGGHRGRTSGALPEADAPDAILARALAFGH
ncbi:hypothetical protein M2271_000760 [Streptomyces sp. LBL]|nr:hypothetical protein [Streptomyces sp. LBL]